MKDILERLRGYNPPDRTINVQRQLAIDIQDAAEEIERLRRLVLEAYIAKRTGVRVGEKMRALFDAVEN